MLLASLYSACALSLIHSLACLLACSLTRDFSEFHAHITPKAKWVHECVWKSNETRPNVKVKKSQILASSSLLGAQVYMAQSSKRATVYYERMCVRNEIKIKTSTNRETQRARERGSEKRDRCGANSLLLNEQAIDKWTRKRDAVFIGQ